MESRLDITPSSSDFLHNVKNVQYVWVCESILDHKAQYIDLQGQPFEKSKNPPFRAQNSLLYWDDYVKDANAEMRAHSMEHLVHGKNSDHNKTVSPSFFYSQKFEVSAISLLSSVLDVAADHAKVAWKLKKSAENHQLQSAISEFNKATQNVTEHDCQFNRDVLQEKNDKLQRAREDIINTHIKNYDCDWDSNWEKPNDFFFKMVKKQGARKTITTIRKFNAKSKKNIYITKQLLIKEEMANNFEQLFIHKNCCDSLESIQNFIDSSHDSFNPSLTPVHSNINYLRLINIYDKSAHHFKIIQYFEYISNRIFTSR